MACGAVASALAAFTFLNVGSAFAQSQPAPGPEFESASIKRSAAQPAGHTDTNFSVNTTGDARKGKLSYTNVSVNEVLERAYQVKPYQITGGPGWLGSERFDITAVIPAGATQEQALLMLQNLLMDRFQLALHRESKELPVLVLTVGKNGPRVRPVDGKNNISSNVNGKRWHVTAKTTMGRFAEFLSDQFSRPVLDSTGLNGAFEIALDWTGDDVSGEPSIYTAVQEQLGLNLEARKSAVEILAVDRIERPAEN